MVVIDKKLCKGCGICVYVCPRKLLKLSEKTDSRGVHIVKVVVNDECSSCHLCEYFCPDHAICCEEKG